MKFNLMQPGQEESAIDIVKIVFDEFVAPEFSQEGRTEFYKYASSNALSERSEINHFTILAQQNETAIGILEIRDFSHVSMFFVLSNFQKQGIGKDLLKKAINRIKQKQKGIHKLTVNSSPNAVNAYLKLGFKAKTDEQCIIAFDSSQWSSILLAMTVNEDITIFIYKITNHDQTESLNK